MDHLSAGAIADVVLAPDAAELADGVRLLCIDGLAGAGKTTLAHAVAARVRAGGRGVAVVHMDDLYEGWGGLLGARDQLVGVLEALARGERASFRRWDWHASRRGGTLEVPAADVVVVEGCGSAPPFVDGRAALRVWVAAPDALRLRRGLERDGEAMRPDWLAFMADERQLLARDATDVRADVVLGPTGEVLRGAERLDDVGPRGRGSGPALWEDRGHA
ncbi:uridine kinase family protein [Litorihabitans aurantiacus]|uniref:Adenylate kinase n=1 Tax=Litorihabitans aurantiacus TaxID=1930061 RepID=A0AA38CP36_9MICO|nr:uridine kinase [Litorihabitans aurantiacus]GMA31658.1 adenylate kinase [Litorihabitans aurantiacus]